MKVLVCGDNKKSQLLRAEMFKQLGWDVLIDDKTLLDKDRNNCDAVWVGSDPDLTFPNNTFILRNLSDVENIL